MKKQYYVWKDGKQNLDGKQEWVELTAKEFLEICNHNRKVEPSDRRYFARVPGVEEDDTYYLLECDYNSYLKSVAEAMERWRNRKKEEQLIKEGLTFEIISLDFSMTDENDDAYTLLDVIPDLDSLFEDKLILSMDLNKVLVSLSEEERNLIDVFYLSSNPKTERAYAEEIKKPYSTVHRNKIKVLKKMKEKMAQNSFSVTT